jgi:hypothetical protein
LVTVLILSALFDASWFAETLGFKMESSAIVGVLVATDLAAMGAFTCCYFSLRDLIIRSSVAPFVFRSSHLYPVLSVLFSSRWSSE